jgi:hypothetical protein
VNKPEFVTRNAEYTINNDSLIFVYVDSLNSVSNSSQIPEFLLDPCFERNSPILYGFHSGKDARWEIIKRVSNETALEIMLKNPGERLKVKCENEKSKQEINSNSFYDLLLKRYNQLKRD